MSCWEGSQIEMRCLWCSIDSNRLTSKDNSAAVQSIIDRLHLEYVEKGAQVVTTYREFNAAQQTWCDSLVKIGTTYSSGGDYQAVAQDIIDNLYNYDNGKVFFKPTLASGDKTFRLDNEGAISYFVGGNEDYPDDKGFALKPWVACQFDNAGEDNQGIQIYGNVAITMGNVWVTDAEGNEVMVNKTWVFKKGNDGKLLIIVHKSSLPFNSES